MAWTLNYRFRKVQWIRVVSIRPHFNFMREGRLVSNLLVVSVVVIQQECRQKSRGSFSFLSRCVLCFQFYPPCVGRFQFIPQWADKIEKCEWFIITETTLLFSIYARPTELFQMRPNWKGRVSGIISILSARECCRPTYYFNFFRAIRNKMKVPESTVLNFSLTRQLGLFSKF